MKQQINLERLSNNKHDDYHHHIRSITQLPSSGQYISKMEYLDSYESPPSYNRMKKMFGTHIADCLSKIETKSGHTFHNILQSSSSIIVTSMNNIDTSNKTINATSTKPHSVQSSPRITEIPSLDTVSYVKTNDLCMMRSLNDFVQTTDDNLLPLLSDPV